MRGLHYPRFADIDRVNLAIRVLALPTKQDVTVPDIGWGPREIAIIAQDVVEVMDAADLEAVVSGSDWLLAVSATVLTKALSKKDQPILGLPRSARVRALYQAIAATDTRSPGLDYETIYAAVAKAHAEAGDRTMAITRQRQSVKEAVYFNDQEGVYFALTELADLHLQLGEADAALRVLTAIAPRRDASMDCSVALHLVDAGLPVLGTLVAQRAREMALRANDLPLHRELGALLAKARGTTGATSSVSASVEATFRSALAAAPTSHWYVQAARDGVEDFENVRVKRLAAMPDADRLEELSQRLRLIAEELARTEPRGHWRLNARAAN